MILPAQDLQAETVGRIEEATRKIGQALKVTGPFNIQFIAKNNEIKVRRFIHFLHVRSLNAIYAPPVPFHLLPR